MRRGALLAAAAALLGGCGGGDDRVGRGDLVWADPPVLVRVARLPSDRIVYGSVRNDSFKRLTFKAADLKVRDARGRTVPATARFAASYAHGLYGVFQRPDAVPAEELQRLGVLIRLDPGKTAPLVVAFRLRAGTKPPLTVDYGQGFLPVPARATR